MIDPAAIRTYCEIVFRDPPPRSLIALRGFAEPKKNNNSSHTPLIDPFAPGWIDGVVSFVQTCGDKGMAAYCIPGFVSGRRSAAADVLTLPTLVIDFDKGDIVENYMKATRVLGSPSLAVRSGGRINDQPKTHLYWRLRGDTTAKRVTMMRGLAASLFDGDNMFGAGRAHQPIRIAGSVHRKAEPVPVEIAYISPLVLDVEEVERQLVSAYAPRPTVSGEPTSYDLPRPNALGLQRKVSLDELSRPYVATAASAAMPGAAMAERPGNAAAERDDRIGQHPDEQEMERQALIGRVVGGDPDAIAAKLAQLKDDAANLGEELRLLAVTCRAYGLLALAAEVESFAALGVPEMMVRARRSGAKPAS